MKAIRVEKHGGPEVLELRDVPEPQPAAGQVRIRVHAAGVNPVETYIRAGQQGYGAPLPYTPGGDAAGVVDAVGADVSGVKAGDRVFTSRAFTGSYAEKALASAADVYPLPEHVTFQAGAAIGRAFFPTRRCWCTARAAASARLPCSSRAPRASR